VPPAKMLRKSTAGVFPHIPLPPSYAPRAPTSLHAPCPQNSDRILSICRDSCRYHHPALSPR
jgi:hypothetical protein